MNPTLDAKRGGRKMILAKVVIVVVAALATLRLGHVVGRWGEPYPPSMAVHDWGDVLAAAATYFVLACIAYSIGWWPL